MNAERDSRRVPPAPWSFNLRAAGTFPLRSSSLCGSHNPKEFTEMTHIIAADEQSIVLAAEG